MTFELLFKCIILGDSGKNILFTIENFSFSKSIYYLGVGKTCLMTQLKDKKFQSQHVPVSLDSY